MIYNGFLYRKILFHALFVTLSLILLMFIRLLVGRLVFKMIQSLIRQEICASK